MQCRCNTAKAPPPPPRSKKSKKGLKTMRTQLHIQKAMHTNSFITVGFLFYNSFNLPHLPYKLHYTFYWTRFGHLYFFLWQQRQQCMPHFLGIDSLCHFSCKNLIQWLSEVARKVYLLKVLFLPISLLKYPFFVVSLLTLLLRKLYNYEVTFSFKGHFGGSLIGSMFHCI